MTNEERDIISQFIARVGGASAQPSFAGGSVPTTQQPALPPIDRDADQFIAQNLDRYPEARYRITQLAFVQERALIEAQNRIKRLEWELQQTQQAAQQAAQQSAQRPAGGGFLSGLFGGGNRQQAGGPPPGGAWGGGQQQQYQPSAPPPQPQYPPNYQQGSLPRSGSGFLGSALTTAAGVAGGMVAGNALMSLFSPHQGLGGGFGGGMAGDSPWANPGAVGQDAVDTGGWNSGAAPAGNQDYVDNGSWDQAGGGDTSWTDNSGGGGGLDSGGGGGWDSGGGGGSDDTF